MRTVRVRSYMTASNLRRNIAARRVTEAVRAVGAIRRARRQAFRRNIAARRVTEAVRAVGAIRRARSAAYGRRTAAARTVQRALLRSIGRRRRATFNARLRNAQHAFSYPQSTVRAPISTPYWYQPLRGTELPNYRQMVINRAHEYQATGRYTTPRPLRSMRNL